METARLGVVVNTITSFLTGISGFPSFYRDPHLINME
jgi:hypothetical protein